MSLPPPPATIATLPAPTPAEDFVELMKQAREDWLPVWCAGQWSDFNDSDPGVMIVEQLTYALTGLAYRAQLPVETLLANGRDEVPKDTNSLYGPEKILTMHPLTAADYARLIYDRIPECVYAEVRPCSEPDDPLHPVAGRLEARIAFDPDATSAEDSASGEASLIRARELLREWRNLGERFEQVIALVPRFVDIEFSVEFDQDDEVGPRVAELYLAAKRALLPGPLFRTLWQSRDQITIDAAFSGPLLDRGIVLDEDMPRRFTWPEAKARLIDALTGCGLSLSPIRFPSEPTEKAPLLFAPGRFVDWKPELRSDRSSLKTAIHFQSQPATPLVRRDREKRHTSAYIQSGGVNRPVQFSRIYPSAKKIAPGARIAPTEAVGAYHSIQSQFPPCFALGAGALDSEAGALRFAQVKQLKGYLLLFEQLMANYYAQLAHTADFFSNRPQPRTAFVQPLQTVPEVLPLLKGWPGGASPDAREGGEPARQFWGSRGNPYLRGLEEIAESEGQFFERRQRILDHLLARFNESHPARDPATHATIANKEWLLQEYPDIGFRRAASADSPPPKPSPHRRPTSGLEKKIRLLLSHDTVAGSDPSTAGADDELDFYFVIEPIRFLPLLKTNPEPAANGLAFPLGAFGPSLVHVFVNWTVQAFTEAFKRHVTTLVLANAPAHLWHRFVWLDERPQAGETAAARDARVDKVQAFQQAFAWWQAARPAYAPLELARPVEAGAGTIWVRADNPAAGLFSWLQRELNADTGADPSPR